MAVAAAVVLMFDFNVVASADGVEISKSKGFPPEVSVGARKRKNIKSSCSRNNGGFVLLEIPLWQHRSYVIYMKCTVFCSLKRQQPV